MKPVRRALAGLAVAAWMSGCTTTVTPVSSVPKTPFVPLPSQTIFSVRHLADSGDLTVILKTGEVLEFRGVPAPVVEEWRNSADPDAFFQEKILGVKRGEPGPTAPPAESAAPAPAEAAAPAEPQIPGPEATIPQPDKATPETEAGPETKGPS
jgi:hypothetical protein